MIKFLFIFLFSLNASANLFGRGMLMTKATLPPPSANIRCWLGTNNQNAGDGICGPISNNSATVQTTGDAGLGSTTIPLNYKFNYYCPSLSSFSSWTNGTFAKLCSVIQSGNFDVNLDSGGPIYKYDGGGGVFFQVSMDSSKRIYRTYWDGSSCVTQYLAASACENR